MSRAGSYPKLATRIGDFDARRASGDAATRVSLVREVAELVDLDDGSRFAGDVAACDQDAKVRGAAVDALVRNGQLVLPTDLPLGIGEPGDHYPASLDAARSQVRGAGAAAGWAAHYLAIFGDASDVSALEALTKDPNIFARYASAMSLLARGFGDRAIPVLDAIARKGVEPGDHFYVERALLALHAVGDPTALTDLVAFLDEIDDSAEPNDAAHTQRVLTLLSFLAGEWRDDATSWRAWLAAEERPTKSVRRAID